MSIVKHYQDQPLPPALTQEQNEVRKKQNGAIQAMQDPFQEENNWFAGYDWVIRMNPDVLIRRDEWLRATMMNETIDAILIDLTPVGVHTDFTVFRPSAVNKTRLLHTRSTNAENHMLGGVEHLVQSGRIAWLPHATQIPRFSGRVVGPQSDVIHHHSLVKYCPDYFNATDGTHF